MKMYRITGIGPSSDQKRSQCHYLEGVPPTHRPDTGHLCPDMGKDVTQGQDTTRSTQLR